jgi:hypothetical protein
MYGFLEFFINKNKIKNYDRYSFLDKNNVLYKIYFFINVKIFKKSFYLMQLDLANKMNWFNYERLSNAFNSAIESKNIGEFRDKFKAVCDNKILLSIASKNQVEFYKLRKKLLVCLDGDK